MKKLFLILILFFPFFSQAKTYDNSDIPNILPRSSWETKEEILKRLEWEKENAQKEEDTNPNSNEKIPNYAPVERIIIHDTGCKNSAKYCNKDNVNSEEVIRSIFETHAFRRGWGDIGYNYIIDRKGNIYEARLGGNGVRGAHVYDSKNCQNFNVGTVGISILGNYEKEKLPQKAYDTLVKLTAWLASANNIDPKEKNKRSLIWSNLKINGACNIKYGSFSKSFVGPTILGHNDLEPANTDPGTINLEKLRIDSDKFKKIYDKYVYSSNEGIFKIENGIRIKTNQKTNIKNIKNIKKEQLNLFPKANKIKLPKGTLIKAKSSNKIFLVENKKRRHISSYAVFKKRNYSLSDVKILENREIMSYPLGNPIVDLKKLENSLVRVENNPEVYIIKNGETRWIKTYQAFKKLGLSMKEVVSIPYDEFKKYAKGSVIGFEVNAKEEKAEIKKENKKIKIALKSLKKTEELKIKSNDDFQIIDKNNKLRYYKKNKVITLKWSDFGDVKIKGKDDNVIFEILNYKDWNWNKKVNFNKFRSPLELKYSLNSDKVWLINELNFEKYLWGIAEALDSDPLEYQKAFSVSARSYALFHLKNNGKYGKNEIFHLNNTPSDQVYRGYTWELYSPKLVEAVKSTKGEFMEYGGKVARAVYSSDSGGTTKNACTLWRGIFCSKDYAYLSGGVKDPKGTKRRSKEVQKLSHGVGMSAAGARRLAETGKNYKEILKYYYKNIKIKRE